MQGLLLAARFARRELRGGLKGFRIFLACLALGVAAIAAVGSLAAAIQGGLQADGRAILGGDLSFRQVHRPIDAAQHDWLAARGTVSEIVQMRAMAFAETGGKAPNGTDAGGKDAGGRRLGDRTLVELKAVDGGYPLYGTVELTPAIPLSLALAGAGGLPGAVADPVLLRRLHLKPGDRLRIGEQDFVLQAALTREPDRGSGGFTLGPKVLVPLSALPGTRLVTLGSLLSHTYRLKLPPGSDAAAVMAAAKQAFPEAGWHIRDWKNGSPGLRRFVDRIGMFLVLVGLTALLVGGVGVANAVRSYLDGKTATIATLKCLGAPGRLIFQVYLLQIMLLALGGILLGLVVGALAPIALAAALQGLLPVPIVVGVYPWPLALALVYGLLTALAFALWPLARAREVSPAGLFRAAIAPPTGGLLGGWPRPGYVVATVAVFLALAAIAVLTTAAQGLALGFVLGAAASLVLLRLLAEGITRAARRAGRPRIPALRLALASICRPGTATPGIVLSLGLGLALLVAVALIQGNMNAEIAERMPAQVPSFFFLDIQPDEVAPLRKMVAATPGAGRMDEVPMLRGRIAAANGVPADRIRLVDPGQRWVLRGDRGLTYAATPPKGTKIVSGQWWPADYKGPELVSMAAEAARGLGLKLGDRITVNVLGRDVTATIASLRDVDWSSLGINFVLIFSPGILQTAPHTHLATVHASPAAEDALFTAVTDRFPNISVVRVKEALQEVVHLLAQVAAAVRAAAAVTLLSGVLVLAGAIVAGRRQRLREAAILKVLGATRGDVLRAMLLEYAILGLATAMVGGLVGWLAAWVVVTQVMGAAWVALPGTLVLTALGATALTVVLGLAGTWPVLAQSPGQVLREI